MTMKNWLNKTLLPNGVLKNKWGITDREELEKVERKISFIKTQDIREQQLSICSIEELKRIHQMLFSDLYDWAGKFREGDFSKDGHNFFPRNLFDPAERNLNSQILHINQTEYPSDYLFASDLAQLLLDINDFHPFREGNGRTQRLFISLLARQKGYSLHFSKDNEQYKQYMQACIEDNHSIMTDIILKSMNHPL